MGYEALKATINFLFTDLNIRKITVGTLSVNQEMINLAYKIGMENDGARLKHEIFNGEPVDILHFSLFNDNY